MFNSNGIVWEELVKAVPSVAAREPHRDVSESYVFVPTHKIVRKMRDAGYVVTTAQEARVREKGGREYAKHLLRFWHQDYLGKTWRDTEVVPEVLVVNSHNRTSSLRAYAGAFRFVCENGMVVGDITDRFHIRHIGWDISDVMAELTRLAQEAQEKLALIRQMQVRVLSPHEAAEFATQALTVRYGQTVKDLGFQPEDLLRARRRADVGEDLWHTFNRVQEGVTKGGLYNHHTYRRSRAINGIDQNINANAALWALALHYLPEKLQEGM